METRRLRLLLTGLLLAVVAYVAFVLVAGFDEVAAGVALLNLGDWAILLALSLPHFLLRFARWHIYLRVLGHRIPAGPSLLYYMSGFALTTTPGKVGETWRAVYLKSHGVPYADAVAGFFAERYTDLLAVIVLSTLAIGLYEGEIWPLALICAVLVGALLALQLPWLAERLERWARAPRIGGALNAMAHMLRASRRLLSVQMIALSFMIALLAWGIQGIVLYAVIQMLGLEADFAVSVGIYALGILAGAASFIPGGLGSAEAVMILMLIVAGHSAPEATATTLLCRIATLWFAIALGVAATAVVELHKRVG